MWNIYLKLTKNNVMDNFVSDGFLKGKIPISQYLKFAVIGLVTGIANGLFGSGGGTIVVPAMVLLLKEEEHVAHATAISIILPLTLVSAFIYVSNSYIDWNLTVKTMLGGIVEDIWGQSFLTSVLPCFKKNFCSIYNSGGCENDNITKVIKQRGGQMVLFLIGLASGIISGMGIGGGSNSIRLWYSLSIRTNTLPKV